MLENEQVYEAALDAIRAGQSACIVTLIESQGSTPREVGAKMLLRPDGSTVGTIGGGAFEQGALDHARSALADGESRVMEYSLRGDSEHDLGMCGGTAKVYIEVLRTRPILLILGAGHVAKSLAEFGHLLGFRVVIVDDRAEYANTARFPHADRIVVMPFQDLIELATPSETFAVVVTRNHEFDAVALRQVLSWSLPYVGMIGSQRKVRSVLEELLREGVPRERLAQVRAPIGLDIGGQTPAEIGLSVMAEIVMIRHQRSGSSLSDSGNPLRANRVEDERPSERCSE